MGKLTKIDYNYSTRFDRSKLSDFLPYDAYDPKRSAFLSFEEDDSYVGWIIECIPPSFANETQVKMVESLLETHLPNETIIQIALFGDPNVKWILDRFIMLRESTFVKDKLIGQILTEEGILTPEQVAEISQEQKESKKMFGDIALSKGYITRRMLKKAIEKQLGISRNWVKKYAQYIKDHIYSGFHVDVPVPVRNYRMLVTIKIPTKNHENVFVECKSQIDSIMSMLGANHYFPRFVTPEDLMFLLWWFLNPEIEGPPAYNPTVPIKEQLLSPETLIEWNPSFRKSKLKINDRYISVLTCSTFPKHVSIFEQAHLLGDYMGDNFDQIYCPFILVLTFLRQKVNPKIYSWAEQILMLKPRGSSAAKTVTKQREAVAATHLMDEEHKNFYNFFLNFILYSDSPTTRDRDVSVVRTIWKEMGFDLLEEAVYPIAPFLFSLPLGPKSNKQVFTYMKSRSRPAPVDTISELAPIQAEARGAGEPVMLFVSRRGQLMSFDLFSGSQTNYNCLVYAQSRAGKSFMVNYMITCYHSLGAQIWVIDVGGSYEKLAKFIGGDYLRFKFESTMCLNPFTNVQDIRESLTTLAALVERMAKPREGCSEKERQLIREAVQAAWDKYENEATITSVADFLASRRDPAARELAMLLSDYTAGGIYAQWFDGESNINFESSPFVVLELEELSKDKNLRNVILLLVMQNIQEIAYRGGRSRKKLVIIDEGWQFFRDEESGMSYFIEEGFRRIAKYLGAFVVIFQGLDDCYESEVGRVMVENSAHQIIMRQVPEVIDRLIKEKKIAFPEGFAEYLKSIHTVKGKYSELFLRSGDQVGGIGRLFVDEFTYGLFTTDGEKVAFLEEKLKQGWSLEDAINEAIRTNYGGKAIDSKKDRKNEYEDYMNEIIDIVKSSDPEILRRIHELVVREYYAIRNKIKKEQGSSIFMV